MNVVDEMCLAKGVVSPSFVDLSTGKRIPFTLRNNKLSYMAAEAVAAAFGGDPSYIPARIGFIYGDEDSFDSNITRNQNWEDLVNELNSGDAIRDVQVVNFSYSPTLGGENRASSGDSGSSGGSGGSGGSDDYSHILPNGSNAITFHAVSNSQDVGSLFGRDTFHDGSYIYQCLLLGYHAGRYYIIARASLEDFSVSSGSGDINGKYLRKPSGFEVALDWTVVFH